MNYENVKLWFAKNESDNIVTVDEINEENKNDTYLCPVCGSNLKPKAIKSKQVTSHFAHVDASKCNSETMIHWWFKHKFIEKGDKFTIASDEVREYVCKGFLVEEPYETDNGVYKPDVTILTECGNTIYFEMAFSNKKQIKDYLDIWLELKNIVVEIDIKQLMLKDQVPTFKALFYDGKCFNTKRNDAYYNTVGKYKEKNLSGKVDDELKERIRKLDWFWDEVLRYQNKNVEIEYMIDIINFIKVKENKDIIIDILKRQKCISIIDDYKNYLIFFLDSVLEKYRNKFNDINLEIGYSIIEQKRKYETLFLGINVEIFSQTVTLKKTKEILPIIENLYNFEMKKYIQYKPLLEIENLFDYESVCKNIDYIEHPIKLEIINNPDEEPSIKVNRIGYRTFSFDEISEIQTEIEKWCFTLNNAKLLDDITKEIKEEVSYCFDNWKVYTKISSFNNYDFVFETKNSFYRPMCGNTYLNIRIKLSNTNNTIIASFNGNEVNYTLTKESFNEIKNKIIAKINWIVERVKLLNEDTKKQIEKLYKKYNNLEYSIKNPNEVLIKLYRISRKYCCNDVYEILLRDYKLYMDSNVPKWKNVKNIINELETITKNNKENKDIQKIVFELNLKCKTNCTYPKEYVFIDFIDSDDNIFIEFIKKTFYKAGESLFKFKIDKNLTISEIKEELIKKISKFESKNVGCVDCNHSFYLTFGELEFYDNKGLRHPRRCKSCRDKKKQLNLGGMHIE